LGRPPKPGTTEAVAGCLARADTFSMDGETYRVTGRLRAGVAGLANSYVISYESHRGQFTSENGATLGWIDPNGLERLESETVDHDAEQQLRMAGGSAINERWLTISAVVILAIMAAAGSVAHIRLLRKLSTRPHHILKPILDATVAWPRMFAGFHAFLFGCFFSAMSAALVYPRINLVMIAIIHWLFTEGQLGDIGNAYESGNIVYAAWMTFKHNYLVATVSFAIVPSLVLLFSGFVVNAFQFCVTGLGLSPTFAGSITHFSYHSITMVLELEAYIVASFLIVLWPFQLFIGVASGRIWSEWRKGIEIVASGSVLVGIMLAIAALYEATTLILFR
jgi:hypothetical protein